MISTDQITQKINNKTKPLGSLGTLEDLAVKICRIQNTLSPSVNNAKILVFAGDHGLCNSPISCYPQEVTQQMVYNFINGGAAINVFCNLNNIDLKIIDAGVKNLDYEKINTHPNFISKNVEQGTKCNLSQDAISEEQLNKCFDYGKEIIHEQLKQEVDIIGFGEMGIGNTSASALITSRILGIRLEDCVGKGTGLNDKELLQKIEVLQQVNKFHKNANEPLEILKAFGGFEMAMMVSAMLETYNKHKIILVDGFISTASFLVAYKINPKILENTIFSHCSDEKVHRRVLETLKVTPILDLKLRLGEGTGAALAYPLIKASCEFLNKMSSFEDASVSNRQ